MTGKITNGKTFLTTKISVNLGIIKNPTMKLFLLVISCFYFLNLNAQAPGSLDLTFAGTGFASYGPVSTTAMDNAQEKHDIEMAKKVAELQRTQA